MLPDALPPLIDTLLRLPLLDAAQLRELMQHLPDPQASAQEMARRGWITQDQFSSLFPGPRQRPAPRETLLIGFGDDEVPPDPDCDTWNLTVSDEEDKADVPPEVELARPERADEEMPPEPDTEAAPVLSGAASTPHFEWDMLVPPVAGEACGRESDTEKRLKHWMGWASKGLLMWTLFLGSFFAGRQLFGVYSTTPRVTRQRSSLAKKKTRVPTGKRWETSPRIIAAKADKVPNNRAAAGDRARAVALLPQPAAPRAGPVAVAPAAPVMFPAHAAPPHPPFTAPTVWNGPVMFPAQATPQQCLNPPRVWNGPVMFPAHAAPQQFPDPQDVYFFDGLQQWVRQQQQMARRMVQRRRQIMPRQLLRIMGMQR